MCADHAPLPSPAAAHAVVRADIMYGGDGIITTPTDPNIRERENFLEIVRRILSFSAGSPSPSRPCRGCQLGTPASPKLGMDTHVGWFGYLMKNNLCWVKKYPTYPDRAYGEICNFPLCIFYYQDTLVELEPIGPRETVRPT